MVMQILDRLLVFLLQHLSDSGEDIADTETDDSSEYDYDDEFEDDGFIDDDEDGDLEIFPDSPVPNSGGIFFTL